MTSTLQSYQISEMINNQAQRESSTSRSTLSVIETSIFDIVNDNNKHISADNSDNTIEDFETVTAHNQKVIECQ